LQQILSSWVGGTKSFANVRVTVDIDPYSFL
jgi:primosomal protein N'